MKIFLGADHAGFQYKELLKDFLTGESHQVTDCGAYDFNPDDDYPDFVIPVAKAIGNDPERSRGIIIGGSGQGEAICANRFPGIRAVVFNGPSSVHTAEYSPREYDEIVVSREHNDANILSLGAWFLTFDEVRHAVERWLNTPFSNEPRHLRRLNKIDDLSIR